MSFQHSSRRVVRIHICLYRVRYHHQNQELLQLHVTLRYFRLRLHPVLLFRRSEEGEYIGSPFPQLVYRLSGLEQMNLCRVRVLCRNEQEAQLLLRDRATFMSL